MRARRVAAHARSKVHLVLQRESRLEVKGPRFVGAVLSFKGLRRRRPRACSTPKGPAPLGRQTVGGVRHDDVVVTVGERALDAPKVLKVENEGVVRDGKGVLVADDDKLATKHTRA